MKFQADEFTKTVQSIGAETKSAATVNGASADTKNFDELLVILNLGEMVTGSTVDLKLQDSADDSTFADITGAVATQLVEATDEDKTWVGRLNLKGDHARYIRPVVTIGTANADLSVDLVLLDPKYAPASQVNTVMFSV